MYLIHYFYPSKKGGTERFTLNLAKEQKRLGNHPYVLVLDANEPKSVYTEEHEGILYRYYEYDGIPCIGFRHKFAPYGLYYKNIRTDDVQMRRFADHITEKHGVDVVHATYPQPFASFLAECGDRGIPYVVTCTDFCMMCHYSTMVDKNGDFCAGSEGTAKCAEVCKTYGCPDFAKRKKNAEEILAGARLVTVPSEFVARVMSKEFPEIAFVPVAHGISDAFKYREREGRVKKFVYAGTLSPLKGVHMLIDAFKSMPGDDLTLDIYGDGDGTYIGKLRSAADERVKFHGAVPGDMMPAIYSEADCVIVPSMWYETYNFVLREALMTGALVVSADIGAMPEAVNEGENGYLFAPSEVESLKAALRKAADFDFTGYKRRNFPTLAEEAEIYCRLYKQK
jgi:glycosyltransferase involved in cell wall biosynthesis